MTERDPAQMSPLRLVLTVRRRPGHPEPVSPEQLADWGRRLKELVELHAAALGQPAEVRVKFEVNDDDRT